MLRQNSFLAIAQNHKRLRCEKFLEEMEKVVPWDAFQKEIMPYYGEKETGRKRMDLVMMLKIYFLQQWYALSDREAEEMIYDRNSFQKFLGIDLLSQAIPDDTTILHFRHLLEAHMLQKRFFSVVKEQLTRKGFLMKEGTIVDATIIAAPSSTKNREQKRDREMSQTKKGNQWHFGMKAHIGADSQSGIVHSLETTKAKTHDRVPFRNLLHGKEKMIFGDKGYADKTDKRAYRKMGILWAVKDRAAYQHPLSTAQHKRNKKFGAVRAKVEHPFQVLKCQWGYAKVRYKGLFKNTMQLFSLFALVNLFRMRKRLMTVA